MSNTYDVDHVLEKIGSLGLYQKRLLLMLAYSCIVSGSMMTLIPSFTAAEPNWRCRQTSLMCNLTGDFGPTKDEYRYRCNIDRDDWEFVPGTFTSIITEFNLVCDLSILQSVSQSMVFAGWFFGLIFFGMIADKYGRRPALFSSTLLTCSAGLISAFSPTAWFYVLFRFITGFGIGGAVMAMVVVSTEFCGVNMRGFAGACPWLGWSLGNGLLPLMAYFIRDWRHLSIAASVPGFVALLFWWWIPETPRWLMIAGREEEAEKILRDKVAKMNKKLMPEGKLQLAKAKPKDSKNGNFFDLFRSRYMTKVTLVTWFVWFAVSLQSYGVQFAAVAMSGNKYVNAFAAGIALFPATAVQMILQDRCGRRIAVTICLLIAFVSSLISIFLPDASESVGAMIGRLVCFFTGKTFASAGFGVAYVYSAELYPTTTRNVGMSWGSAMARIGSFSAPYVVWLRQFHSSIPMAIMATGSLTAALLIQMIRETKSAPTIETFAEIDYLVEYKDDNNNNNNNNNDDDEEQAKNTIDINIIYNSSV